MKFSPASTDRNLKRSLSTLGLCALLGAPLSVVGASLGPTAAFADECTSGSSVFENGQTGGATAKCTDGAADAGNGFTAADHRYKIIERHPTETCIDKNGVPSFMAFLQRGNAAPIYRCVNQGKPGAGRPTAATAKLLLKAPVIRSDFQEKFLVGAPTKFSLGEPGVAEKDVPGFNATIEATPTSVLWDFGDGTTSTDLNPTHVFETKGVNSDHKSRITVSVTYNAVLRQDSADGGTVDEQNLGDIQLTSTPLERPIVEVWSALIPKS